MPRRALRIAVVAPLAAPIGEPEPYGNHALLIDLARGLAARGHRVRLYAAEGSRVPDLDVACIPVEPAARGAFIHVCRFGNEEAGGGEDRDDCKARAMRRSFERLFDRLRADRPDVVSQHAFDAEAFELSEGLPVVHTLHMPPLVPAVVEACRHARAPLVSVSRFAQIQWQAAGVDTELIPNGIPDFGIPPGPLSQVRKVAVVAGRICREKGTAAAIRAGLAAGLDVEVIGGIYDRHYFTSEVAPLVDGCRVQLERAVPRRALWERFARSTVCLMPIAWDEPFGLVAAEAQLAGCPVVGYARGALLEVVTQHVSGFLVSEGDERALAACVRKAGRLDRRRIRADARPRLLFRGSMASYEALLGWEAARRRERRHSKDRSSAASTAE